MTRAVSLPNRKRIMTATLPSPSIAAASLPAVMERSLDRIDELSDLLDQEVKRLHELSWGPGDDGAHAQPVPDGTAARLHAWLQQVAAVSLSICEYKKDLAQPGESC